MISANIRAIISREEFDYQTLQGALAEYASPRDKITSLLSKGTIIRVKKGLYIFGREQRKVPFSPETLANLIYGPSYISLEYGLYTHGLIPEKVATITSVTVGGSRAFSTPVGKFTYRKIPIKSFATGMDLVETPTGGSYLIAVPEKALVDKIISDRGTSIRSQSEMQKYLVENLRLELNDVRELDPGRIEEYSAACRSRKAKILGALIKRLGSGEKQRGKSHA